MPLTHLIIEDREYEVKEALDLAGQRRLPGNWTYEVLASIVSQQQDRGEKISTTTLTAKCLRSEALKRTQPFSEDPQKLYAAWRGTQMHADLEQFAAPSSYGEVRFHATWNGEHLSGSPDLVDPMIGVLYDYKNTREAPRYNKPWPDHALQLQINRWLIDHAHSVELQNGKVLDLADPDTRERYVPIEWQDLIVVYLDEKGCVPMPVLKSIDVPKVGGVGTKKARVADIWSDEQVEEYFEVRYPEAKEALESGIAPVPEGWEFQSHILCQWCPMRRECGRLEREGK